MSIKERVACPACEQKTLGDHCDNQSCDWEKCINLKCRATVNRIKQCGFKVDPGRPGCYLPVYGGAK